MSEPLDRQDLAERVATALNVIDDFGGTDGAHHKMWVIDQVVRALTGCPLVTHEAINYKGHRYTYEAPGESLEYIAWVAGHCRGEDGPDTYDWDTGIAP